LQEKYLAGHFDTLILIRWFETDVPRMEETMKNFKAIAEYRAKMGFDSFLLKRLDRDDE
jgi:hypothetical protein